MKNPVGNPKFRQGEIGLLAREFLILLINNHVVTDTELTKLGHKKTAILNQYKRLVVMGFNIKRRIISLNRRYKLKFERGVIPNEAVYYL